MDWFLIIKGSDTTRYVYADNVNPVLHNSTSTTDSATDGAIAWTLFAAKNNSHTFYNDQPPTGTRL